MVEIKKVYRESLPAHRLIGKRYSDADRVNGSFGAKWGEWFQNGWFGPLDKLGTLPESDSGSLGFMAHIDGVFEYWIGYLFPADTPVPEGYEYLDIPAGDIGTCWLYGQEDNGELYGEEPHTMCAEKMKESGWSIQDNFRGSDNQGFYFFERYNCPRFTEKDIHGKVVLDYCFYLK